MVTWIGLERTGLPRVDSESVADSSPSTSPGPALFTVL